MSQPKSFNIAIIGGGIAGLTLAVALHERQIPVTVYEQASHFGEIGAGVSFGPNAVQAMTICSPGIKDAFLKVSTKNGWPSKKDVWFDVFNGYNTVGPESTPQESEFQILVKGEHAGVYRAHFLDEVVKLVPKGIAKFGKRLDSITDNQENGKLVMRFFDGTVAEADAIIGCDGIKSRVRQIMLGHDHPSANPVYTHKYAYRGLIPMDKAVAVMGEEMARNSCLHVRSPDPHKSPDVLIDGRWGKVHIFSPFLLTKGN
jgi:salicylate hydroxylase